MLSDPRGWAYLKSFRERELPVHGHYTTIYMGSMMYNFVWNYNYDLKSYTYELQNQLRVLLSFPLRETTHSAWTFICFLVTCFRCFEMLLLGIDAKATSCFFIPRGSLWWRLFCHSLKKLKGNQDSLVWGLSVEAHPQQMGRRGFLGIRPRWR